MRSLSSLLPPRSALGDLTSKYLGRSTHNSCFWRGWLVDDYRKVVEKDSRGLHAMEVFLAIGYWRCRGYYLFTSATQAPETTLYVPFLRRRTGNGASFYPSLLGGWIGNAVNLTDGLDGLAILPTVMVAGLGMIAYLGGHTSLPASQHCHVAGTGDGGVLWRDRRRGGPLVNTYPAMVFMGDVGAPHWVRRLHCRRHHPPRVGAIHHGRCIRYRNAVRHYPSGVIQTAR